MSRQHVENHFVEMHEMVLIGSGAERKMESYAFSCFSPDNMGSTELAANLFRATQTDEKLRREKIS